MQILLRTDRLVFRPLTTGDIPLIAELYGDPAVTAGWHVEPFTGSRLQERVATMLGPWQAGDYRQFVITEARTDEVVGIGGVRPVDVAGVGEVGGVFRPSAWGQGYAGEATVRILDWAFDDLALDRVVAEASASNPASTRVLQKFGFTSAGEVRGPEGNTYVGYSLDRAAWKRVRAEIGLGH